jgi:hypothetical protein
MTFAVRPIGLIKSIFVWRPTISADVTNWVLYSQAIAAGWDGVVPLDAEVTVASGIVLSAGSTGTYGFDTGSGFPVGTSLKLIMPGYVCGMGGAGGATYTAGSNGGPALRAQHAITIDALGGVTAGGGGGGGGSFWGGGGGGRSGRADAVGGSGSYPGAGGTFVSGGNGGNSGGVGGTTGPGGAGSFSSGGGGGGWGAAGGAGHGGAVGGAGGAAVVGNAFITWVNSGTRYGSIT